MGVWGLGEEEEEQTLGDDLKNGFQGQCRSQSDGNEYQDEGQERNSVLVPGLGGRGASEGGGYSLWRQQGLPTGQAGLTGYP